MVRFRGTEPNRIKSNGIGACEGTVLSPGIIVQIYLKSRVTSKTAELEKQMATRPCILIFDSLFSLWIFEDKYGWLNTCRQLYVRFDLWVLQGRCFHMSFGTAACSSSMFNMYNIRYIVSHCRGDAGSDVDRYIITLWDNDAGSTARDMSRHHHVAFKQSLRTPAIRCYCELPLP